MKKILIAVLCVVLTAVVAVSGTLALLAQKSNEIKNTFTFGQVGLGLSGDNNYKITKEVAFGTQPTLTVEAESEASWIFMKIIESAHFGAFVSYEIDLYDEQDNPDGKWKDLYSELSSFYANKYGSEQQVPDDIRASIEAARNVYFYDGMNAATGSNTQTMPALFKEQTKNQSTGIYTAKEYTYSDYESWLATGPDDESREKISMDLVAYAVQKSSMLTVDVAWEAALSVENAANN